MNSKDKNQKSKFVGYWKLDIGYSRQRRAGFTMIETVVAVGVLGMFFAAIAFILQQVLTNIGESRVRSTALSIAQTKMELIRNLPYADVGTLGGIPAGPITQAEIATVNGLAFTINTSIIYIDDPFDGEIPDDLINSDYKRVRVEITWEGVFPSRTPVTLVTNIVPKGVETVSGGGTLYLRVFNAGGLPISNATVQIDNTLINPQIHMNTLTNANGLVVIPGAPACISCYEIRITKSGFSTDRTYSTTEVANPLQPHATVIEGQVTQLSFAIDTISTMRVYSFGAGPSYSPVTGVQFALRGSKTIGTTTEDDPVYKYQFSTNTGGGVVEITGLEWDTYTLDFASSTYNLAGSNPIQPIVLPPGSNSSVNIVALPKTNTSLLLIIQNAANELQSSASAQLTQASPPFDVTKVSTATGSADFGQVFFGGLSPGNYNLTVRVSGYQDATASVSLTGIQQQTVTMNLLQ